VNEPVTAESSRAKATIGTGRPCRSSYGAQAMLLSLDELYGLGATHHLTMAWIRP
jgi:hypothetical protein